MFEKKWRKWLNIGAILGVIAGILIEYSINYIPGLFLIFDVCLAISIGLEDAHNQISPIYPEKNKIKPLYFKKFVLWVFSTEELPIEFVRAVYFMFSSSAIYTTIYAVLWITNNDETLGDVLFVLIILITGIIVIYLVHCALITSFKYRFKKVNKHNLRYRLWLTANSTYRWPTSRYLGKCEIIDMEKYKEQIYTTVRLQKSGKVCEKVLLVSETRKGEKQTYKLYDICHIKYIC